MDLTRFHQKKEIKKRKDFLKRIDFENLILKIKSLNTVIFDKKSLIFYSGTIFLFVLVLLFSIVIGGNFVKPAEANSGSQVPARLLLTYDYNRLCRDESWREPMNLTLPKPVFPDGEARQMDWDKAVVRMRKVINSRRGLRLGLFVKDLKTGKTFKYNADSRFASASLVKIPILLTLYRDIADGKIKPSKGVWFEEKLRASGSGKLKSEKSGVKVNLRDLVYLMLQHSDNTATNMLAELVGYQHVTRYCRSMGWKNTNLIRPVMALELRSKGIENWTTPSEMADMIERIYKGTIISRKACIEMIRFMNNPPINDRLPRYLPNEIDVVHKTGLIYDNAHDVGILYLPGEQPVMVIAFVDRIGTDYRIAKETIASIARVLYEEATLPSLWKPGRRR